jgi:metal-responsive CopG/Arc/MetJ family transcriptional regulator
MSKEESADECRRMTITLPNNIAQELDYIAAKESCSQVLAIKRAIGIAKYIVENKEEGGRLYIESPSGERHEVVFL